MLKGERSKVELQPPQEEHAGSTDDGSAPRNAGEYPRHVALDCPETSAGAKALE